MKIGRNDPCPCGSGKKYKKCCINKMLIKEKKKEVEVEEIDSTFNMFFRMREHMLKRKNHIKKYYQLRKVHSEIMDSMVYYHENDKYDFNQELEKAKDDFTRELDGEFHKFNLDFSMDTQSEIHLFYNLLIYKNHPKIRSITEEYLSKNKFRNEDKVTLLKAMNDSYVSLFRIKGIDFDNAFVYLEDVFTKKEFKIIDISFSLCFKEQSDLYFYTRIITVDDISYSTGLCLLFHSDDREVNDYIKKYQKKQTSEFVRFLDLYDIYKRTGLPIKSNGIR